MFVGSQNKESNTNAHGCDNYPCVSDCAEFYLRGITVDRGEPQYNSVEVSRCQGANGSNETEDKDREKYDLKRRPVAIESLELRL